MSENTDRVPSFDEAAAALDVLLAYLKTIPRLDLGDFTMAMDCLNDDGTDDRDWEDARVTLAEIMDPSPSLSRGLDPDGAAPWFRRKDRE